MVASFVFLIVYLLHPSPEQGSASDVAPPEAPEGIAPSPPDTPLDSLLVAGEAVYWEGDFEGARTIWREVLDRARKEKDVEAEADALTWLGLAAWRLGQPEEARRLGKEGLTLKLRHGLTAKIARSYNALGLLAWTEGKLARAADLFQKTADAAREAGDLTTEAKAANNLGLVHTDLGRFDQARQSYRASLSAAREIADTLIRGRVLSNLGMLETRVGDADTGIRLLQEARTLYRASGDAIGEQHTLGQLGVAYITLDRPRLAFAVINSALAQAREHGLRQEEASDLELIGELYRQAGDHRRALDFYRRAYGIYETLGLEIERGSALRSLAEVHLALVSPIEARRLGEEALEVHEETDARIEALADRLLLAWIAREQEKRARTIHHLERARDLAAVLDSRAARTALALTEARIAENADEPSEVLAVLRRAEIDLEAASFRDLAEAEWLRSRALRRQGRLRESVAAGRRAVDAVEKFRVSFRTGALRTAFSFEKREVYADLVASLLQTGEIEEAFEIADAARGRTLVERLAAREGFGSALRARQEEASLLRSIDDLVLRIEELEAYEPDERDPSIEAAREAMTARLVEAQRKFEELRTRRSEIADPIALLGAVEVSVEDILARLEPRELLLAYFLAPDRLHVFLGERGGIRHLAMPVDPPALAAQVRMLRNIVADSPSETPKMLNSLYGTLVQPIEGFLDPERTRRLIVILDGPLVDLPFAALRDDAGTFLVEKHALLHLPAAAMLAALRGRESGEDRRFPVHVLVPFPENLPFTREEAERLERVLGGVSSRTGSSATEAVARRVLAEEAIVHVASHGMLDPTSPLFSRIRFSRGSGEPGDDGRLEVHELLGLPMRSPLVFLSGCETGAGAAWTTLFDRGEDFATLARAFLFAGARNVIATQWRIEDAGAAVFAERFYRHLRSRSPVEALALAQRESIRDPRYSTPYYWAPYRVVGDGEEVVPHNERDIPLLKRWIERLRTITVRSAQ